MVLYNRCKTVNFERGPYNSLRFSRPLHEAVENGDVHLVRLLLGYGADPRLATYSGQSPLSLANDRQTRMLLEHHVNDIQGYGSASAWHFDDTALNRKYRMHTTDFYYYKMPDYLKVLYHRPFSIMHVGSRIRR